MSVSHSSRRRRLATSLANVLFAVSDALSVFSIGLCSQCILLLSGPPAYNTCRFINRYAFSYIALYGKAYIPAAKDTWTMMKNRGIDALVNDCLIGPVLTMGSTFVAYLTTLLAFLYLEFTKPAYNNGGTFTPVVMAFAFLIGLQVCQIFMTPIGSGVE